MANRWSAIEHKRKYIDVARQNLGYLEVFDLMDVDSLILAIQSVGLPNLTQEEVELPYGNSRVWLAGKRGVETISLTLVDTAVGEGIIPVATIIRYWQGLIFNPVTGQLNFPVNYKKQAVLTQLHVDGSILRQWKLENVWPTTVNYGTIDHTGTDKITIEVTLRVDNVVPLF